MNPTHSNKVRKFILIPRNWTRLMSFVSLLLGITWCMAQSCAAAPGVWEYTGLISREDSGHASGRGAISVESGQATFNFLAALSEGRSRGNFSYYDQGAAILISKARVRTVTFTGNSADFSGTADLGGGNRVTFDVSIADNGVGSSDTFAISLSNGYAAGGNLTRGDIELLTE